MPGKGHLKRYFNGKDRDARCADIEAGLCQKDAKNYCDDPCAAMSCRHALTTSVG
jgi:hypothetical protein